jgi:hypothetical protein
MKIRSLLWAVTLSAVGAFSGMAWAQDATSGPEAGSGQGAGAGLRGRLDFLSAEEKAHFLRVRHQVMTDNPDLKTEQESLTKEWQYVRGQGTGASADDKETLRNNFLAHNEKMTAAMVKADPSVQPILDKIKSHRQERFQAGAGGAGAGGGSDNP